MADNSRRYLLYSYWDSNGDGIDQAYLQTLKDSIIFDTYNRTIYSYEGVFGNHQLGTYHGEIFNDFDNNNAAGDYSSAHGTHVTTYNTGEAGFGSYNVSENGKTLLTVGNGTAEEPHNAFEIDKDGTTYINGTTYVSGTAYVSADAYINGNGHISGDSYVNGSTYVDGDVEIEGVTYINTDAYIGGRSVNDTFGRMVSVMPINTTYNAYNGAHYIWMGSQEEYDSIAIKYRNVFYVVLEEAIDNELPIYPQDINSPVVAAPVINEEEI